MQRGQYRKSAQRREEIIEAAFAVFARTGYVASSVSEVAREVGMSQPGLLHHFDGKPALLQAVLEKRDSKAKHLLEGKTSIEFLRALIAISTQNQQERGMVQFYTVLAGEATNFSHPAHSYFQRRARVIVSETTAAFEAAKEQGLLRAGVSPQQAALDLIAFTEGIQLLWLQGFVEIDLGAQARRYLNSYLMEPV